MWLSRLDFPLAAVVIVIVAVGCFPACLVVPRLIGQTNSKPPRLSQLVQTQNIACRARLWHTVATRVRLVFLMYPVEVPGRATVVPHRSCFGSIRIAAAAAAAGEDEFRLNLIFVLN